MDLLSNINNSISNLCKTNLVDIIGCSKSVYILNQQFNLEKFKKSVEQVSKSTDIPINIVENESQIFFKSIELYIIIRNNKMILYSNHKYYDGYSCYIILTLIDNEYSGKNEIFPFDNTISKYKFENNSLLNNISLYSFYLNGNDDIPEDLVLLKQVNGLDLKTSDILEEYQKLLLDFLVIIDTRKIQNIKIPCLGNHFDMYYLKNNKIKNFTNDLKNLKSISEIPSFNYLQTEEYIFFNSLMKFPIISFLDELLPFSQYTFNGIGVHKYFMTVGPPKKDGLSNIYVNKNLYNLIKEKNLI
jgi:hypothetical protein